MKPAFTETRRPDEKLYNGLTRKQYIVTQLCAGDLASQSVEAGLVSDDVSNLGMMNRVEMLARFADEILRIK